MNACAMFFVIVFSFLVGCTTNPNKAEKITTKIDREQTVTGDESVGVKNGNMIVDGNVYAPNFVQSSDRRFKKNIKAIENPLASILNIKGVRYDWRKEEFPEKNFSDKNQIGFIAQDLERIFPEMVFTDEKGYKSVDYGRLTPVLVEAMKDLVLQNETLKNQQEKTTSKLTEIEKKMVKLEALLERNNQ